jgi:hypothetical protein
MKKSMMRLVGTEAARGLSKKEMKQVWGGSGNCGNAQWICGCLDPEDNFYPGPCSGTFCLVEYGAEPWCIRR